MQMPSAYDLIRKSANSRSTIQSFLYLSRRQEAKERLRILCSTCACEIPVYLNQTSENLRCLHPDLNLFERDLEGVSPRVFAEAAQDLQWGKLSEFDKRLFKILLPALLVFRLYSDIPL